MMRIALLFALIFYSINIVSGQYTGGIGDGYSDEVIGAGSLSIYHGDTSDGYSIYKLDPDTLHIFVGGEFDGYDMTVLNQDTLSIYFGDTSDGYASLQWNNGLFNSYLGGNRDGYSAITWLNDQINIFQGGIRDGFTCRDVYQKYIWTGAVGTGWLVDGNWQTDQPPAIRHDAMIPSDALNWPNVNIGLFRIGRDIDGSADYVCRSLTIAPDATLVTRVNCFVENYGHITVGGTYEIKNPSIGAFQNMPGAEVLVLGTMTTSGN